MPKRPGVHIFPCAHFQGKPNLGRNARPLAEAHRTGRHPLQKAQRIWCLLCATLVAFQNKPLYNVVLERVGFLFIFQSLQLSVLVTYPKNHTISNSIRNKYNPKEIYLFLCQRSLCCSSLFTANLRYARGDRKAQTNPQLNLHVSLKSVRQTWRRPKSWFKTSRLSAFLGK